MNVIVLSGGFDPVHDGHIEMFKDAAKKYDYVIVGLNSDEWLVRKKGRAFMGFTVRKAILDSIQYIDQVISFDDSDDTAIQAIEYARNNYQFVTFGNGGDRRDNFPEADHCREHDVAIDDSLGGNTKLNSSSDFLAEWKFQPTDREWGLWKVLADYKTVKVKELVVTLIQICRGNHTKVEMNSGLYAKELLQYTIRLMMKAKTSLLLLKHKTIRS